MPLHRVPILRMMRQARLGRLAFSKLAYGASRADTRGTLPRKAVGRLLSFLTLATGVTLIADALPGNDDGANRELTLMLAVTGLLLAALFWVIPWQRLPRSASLLVLPIGFALIAFGGVVDPNPYTYGLPFLTVYLWIGASHPRWTSVRVLPLAAVAYVVPLINDPAAASTLTGSAAFTLGLCVAFGESLAWVMQRLSAAQTELAGSRSEARFQALTRNAAEIVAILDEAGRVQFCNSTVESLLQIRCSEFPDRPFWERIHPEDRAAARELLISSLGDSQQSHRAEFRMQHADGSWRHIEAVCRDMLSEPEIGGLVLNARDISERKALERQLAHRALHDALTELPTRELLMDRLGLALSRSARSGQHTAVLFVDLDSFKIVNDTLGHQAGDSLLVHVAQRFSGSIRAGDTAARMGGDEFILLLEDLSDPSEAQAIAERCLEQLRLPISLGAQDVTVTASIGIACSDGPGESPGDMLQRADLAMYAAKSSGKGQIAIFDASMQHASLDYLTLSADLQRALDEGQFRVWYQPIVELTTGRITGVEALVRWQHPTRGLVAPDQFIRAAEDTGMIVPIGRWVLREACRQASEWRAHEPLTVSVNLSARQCQHPGLIQDVSAALADSGLPASALKLEITETVAMDAGSTSIPTLQALRGLGVRLAIDDFGTGYSSLAYIKRFPVDTLKVDRSFVGGVDQDAQDSAIVRSVVALARTLGLTVTAEGIETQDQLEVLRSLACDEGQGYLFQRPQPAEVIGDLLQQLPSAA
jgi:diguanylate cyclase (GGDEF)-like protein/PAS domain S-box-containing protein